MEWYNISLRFANALLDIGLKKGDVIAIQYPNTPEFLFAYIGITMMGGVMCTLHMPYRKAEMAPFMNHGRTKAVICWEGDEKYNAPETMELLKSEVNTLDDVIVIGKENPGQHSFEKLISAASP